MPSTTKIAITVNVEGDPASGAGRPNALSLAALPRFQDLCDRYGLIPTYLCSYEAVQSEDFDRTLNSYHARGRAEIGTLLNPWSTPPHYRDPQSGSGEPARPYPSELPLSCFDEKLTILTGEVHDRTGVAPRTFRAGRWGFIAEHVPVLARLGYRCDCSVTPGMTWQRERGVYAFGPDFRSAPRGPYFLDYADAAAPGRSPVVECPVSVTRAAAWSMLPGQLARRLPVRNAPRLFQATPGIGAAELMALYQQLVSEPLAVVQLVVSSADLTGPVARVEAIYDALTSLFARIRHDGHEAATLSAVAHGYIETHRPELLSQPQPDPAPVRWAA